MLNMSSGTHAAVAGPEVNDADVKAFAAVIEARLGHQPDERRADDLRQLAVKRLRKNRQSDYSSYARLLAGDDAAAEAEWHELAPLLTVPETYFFRMPAHFDALALEVIPHLLEQNASRRSLRLLSAGCASGEEAYSLRILLNERFPQLADWHVEILGLDLSEAALGRAREGVYTEWSLRATSAPRRRANFEAVGKSFRLLPVARKGVRFERANLLAPVPQTDASFDVVFCRNVLIYFSETAMREAIERLTERLRPGGYLFLGPAESLRGISAEFELCHRHDSFFYRRKGGRRRRGRVSAAVSETLVVDRGSVVVEGLPVPLGESWFDAIRSSSERTNALLGRPVGAGGQQGTTRVRGRALTNAAAEAVELPLELRVAHLTRQEKFAEALTLLDEAVADALAPATRHLLRALLLTNLDRCAEAIRECGLVLAAAENDAGAFYVLALCREQQGEIAEAKMHLERAVALQPQFAMAQIRRGSLARRLGAMEEAMRAFHSALFALDHEESARLELFGGGFSREGLRVLCRRELKRLETA